jgi:hypothetical protein
MAVVGMNVRKFLEDFERACERCGGIAVKDSTLDYEYVACRFEGKAPAVRIYAGNYVYPMKEWRLSICINTSGDELHVACADARVLDELHISPMGVSVEKRPRGYMEFDGIDGLGHPKASLRYVFEPKDGLKEIRIYAIEDRINVDWV